MLHKDAQTLAIIEALERYNGLSTPRAGDLGKLRIVASEALLPQNYLYYLKSRREHTIPV